MLKLLLIMVLFAGSGSLCRSANITKKAFEDICQSAQIGDAVAQNKLGACFEKGDMVPKNYDKAFYWYRKSAEQGNSSGQYNLGRCYDFGYGVEKDIKEAAYWYQKSAKQGNSYAQNSLGCCYHRGEGMSKDLTKAFYWYRKAAEQDNYYAQYNLGRCYEHGEGVAKDIDMAMNWYQKATAQGHSDAKKKLVALKSRSEVHTVTQQPIVAETNPLPPTIMKRQEKPQQQIAAVSDVDVDVPAINAENNNTFAIIFANENYQEETEVDYALNDGEMFREYCHKVLGLPQKNIHIRKNATLNNMRSEIIWLQKVANAYQGDAQVVIYYAGHGIPDEKTGASYLLPIDGNASVVETGYSLPELYQQLGDLPVKRVIVFMDACFSGSKRGDGMLVSARGVSIKSKTQVTKGQMVVFSAAQGDETAYPLTEQHHGLFTYYLLKKIKETKGNVTLVELYDYIHKQVGRTSIVDNGKSQTPTVTTSVGLAERWKTMKLK